MWTCWRFPVRFVYQRTNWASFLTNAYTLTFEYGSARYVSMQQRRWCRTILIIATTSFLLSVDSLVALIFTASSRTKKAVHQRSGEGGIFDKVETTEITLSLSTRQAKLNLIPTYDAIFEWYSTGQSYWDSEDYTNNKILGYTFARIHSVDY